MYQAPKKKNLDSPLRRVAVIDGNVAKIPLSKGGYALVDKENAGIDQYCWYKDARGYVVTARGQVKLHRFLLNPPLNMCVDHKNVDKLDNRFQNLRVCTQAENVRNQRLKSSKTGFKGVRVDLRNNTFRAVITYNYKRINLGGYKTPQEAALAYDKKAVELFGQFANLNFKDKSHVSVT